MNIIISKNEERDESLVLFLLNERNLMLYSLRILNKLRVLISYNVLYRAYEQYIKI